MKRRDFCKALACCVAGLALSDWAAPKVACAQGAPAKPNIVLVLADDLGYGDVRCLDPQYSKIPTPNLDRLAQQGMVFTDAHAPSSVCSPTRYGILTGRYAWRTRLQKGVLQPWGEPLIAQERLTVAELLKQQGYATAAIGKWHLGMNWPKENGQVVFDRPIAGGPRDHGFDYYFGTDVPNYPPFAFFENDRLTQMPTARFEHKGKDQQRAKEMVINYTGPMVPDWRFDQVLPTITQKAVQHIDQQARSKQPFFLYFPLTTPHEPVAPSERFKGKSGISPVADLIMESDWAVGQVIEALERNGVADNTLLIFTADNGHCVYTGLQPFADAGHRVSGPYRGYKADIWEGGHREPFIARWPGKIPAGSRCEQMIGLTDLMATFAELTGAKLGEDSGVDSVSFLPMLQGRTDRPVRNSLVMHSVSGQFAIREGQWLLALCPEENAAATTKQGQPAQLFNLASDPGQTTNLAGQHPEIVTRLRERLERTVAEGRSAPGAPQKNDTPVDIWKLPR